TIATPRLRNSRRDAWWQVGPSCAQPKWTAPGTRGRPQLSVNFHRGRLDHLMDDSSIAESLLRGCCRACWQRHKHSCEARRVVFSSGLAGSIYHGANRLSVCYENQFGAMQLYVGPHRPPLRPSAIDALNCTAHDKKHNVYGRCPPRAASFSPPPVR